MYVCRFVCFFLHWPVHRSIVYLERHINRTRYSNLEVLRMLSLIIHSTHLASIYSIILHENDYKQNINVIDIILLIKQIRCWKVFIATNLFGGYYLGVGLRKPFERLNSMNGRELQYWFTKNHSVMSFNMIFLIRS